MLSVGSVGMLLLGIDRIDAKMRQNLQEFFTALLGH